MRRGRVVLLAVAVALVAAVGGALIAYDAARSDRIAEGVRVAGIDLGGMSGSQARGALRTHLPPAVPGHVTVTYHGHGLALPRSRAGVRVDVDATVDEALHRTREGNPFGRALRDLLGMKLRADVLPVVRYSASAVAAYVHRIGKALDRSARSADIDVVRGRLKRHHARDGLMVRRPELTRSVTAQIVSLHAGPPIQAPVTVTDRPDLTSRQLAERYPLVVTIARDSKLLRLYRDLRLAATYRIAVGQIGHSTPAGRYEIKSKLVNPPWNVPDESWAGSLAGKTIPPSDPQNPLKARWMGFHDGAGIHGTDDIASLGAAASHGCIRMSIPDVKRLYRKVRVGTPVYIA